MRHLTFYFAIGSAIVGCLMLFGNLSTFIGMLLHSDDVAGTLVLASAMILPFLIAGLSWRDWGEIQKGDDTVGKVEKPSAMDGETVDPA